jgi:hypothetical protein
MRPAVRAYFRDQALDESNAVLFSLAGSGGGGGGGGAPHPALGGFEFGLAPAATPWLRALVDERRLKYLVLAYLLVGGVIVRLLIPSDFVFVAVFSLLFLLCLGLILYL